MSGPGPAEVGFAAAAERYPEACRDARSGEFRPDGFVVVTGNIKSPDEVVQTAALRAVFGAALWVAVLVHAVVTEAYLNGERRRVVNVARPGS